LADAPAKDPDGNLSVVRYSRKNKSQYVMTEVDGKATGWTATFDNDKWHQTLVKKKVTKAKPKTKAKTKTKTKTKAEAN
jgi:DNA topoisomerase-1